MTGGAAGERGALGGATLEDCSQALHGSIPEAIWASTQVLVRDVAYDLSFDERMVLGEVPVQPCTWSFRFCTLVPAGAGGGERPVYACVPCRLGALRPRWRCTWQPWWPDEAWPQHFGPFPRWPIPAPSPGRSPHSGGSACEGVSRCLLQQHLGTDGPGAGLWTGDSQHLPYRGRAAAPLSTLGAWSPAQPGERIPCGCGCGGPEGPSLTPAFHSQVAHQNHAGASTNLDARLCPPKTNDISRVFLKAESYASMHQDVPVVGSPAQS